MDKSHRPISNQQSLQSAINHVSNVSNGMLKSETKTPENVGTMGHLLIDLI